jgi:hypothetical protein
VQIFEQFTTCDLVISLKSTGGLLAPSLAKWSVDRRRPSYRLAIGFSTERGHRGHSSPNKNPFFFFKVLWLHWCLNIVSVHFLHHCPCQGSLKSAIFFYLGYTPRINLCSHTQGTVNQPIKRGIWERVIILGGGIENILSFGGSKRNKFFGVVSLVAFIAEIVCHSSEKLNEVQTMRNDFFGSQRAHHCFMKLVPLSPQILAPSLVFQLEVKSRRILGTWESALGMSM